MQARNFIITAKRMEIEFPKKNISRQEKESIINCFKILFRILASKQRKSNNPLRPKRLTIYPILKNPSFIYMAQLAVNLRRLFPRLEETLDRLMLSLRVPMTLQMLSLPKIIKKEDGSKELRSSTNDTKNFLLAG